VISSTTPELFWNATKSILGQLLHPLHRSIDYGAQPWVQLHHVKFFREVKQVMSVTFNKNFASIGQAELIWTQDGIFEGPIVFLSEKHTSLISWLFSEYKILISLHVLF
jgi:hypothetical protein